jgi:hypothetical protein
VISIRENGRKNQYAGFRNIPYTKRFTSVKSTGRRAACSKKTDVRRAILVLPAYGNPGGNFFRKSLA